MHSRLLSTLVLIEPVILDEDVPGPGSALMSSLRRDIWTSRQRAESSLGRAFASWDQLALRELFEYGLRETSTALYNSTRSKDLVPGSVTLTTSKHQEAWAYAQISFESQDAGLDRLSLSDWDSKKGLLYLGFRSESKIAMQYLSQLRSSVLYIFGASSSLSSPDLQNRKVERIGTGLGGSGGKAEGKVQATVIDKSGHMLPVEQPAILAEAAIGWISKWYGNWLTNEKFMNGYKSKKSDNDMLAVSQSWMDAVKRRTETCEVQAVNA